VVDDALNKIKIGIIGAGVMGQALVKGLLRNQALPADSLWAAVRTEKSRAKLASAIEVSVLTQYANELPSTDVLVLSVKPKSLNSVLKHLRENGLRQSTVVISIVSGHTLQHIEETLGQPNPVIRAMPNTPMIVGEAITVLSAGEHAKEKDLATATAIFSQVGEVLELDEQHLDAVTALSGAGPAYIYLMMEALADGGVHVGLPRDVALKLVTQTMKGAAQMVQELGRHPAALKDDVTTPSGCTIAALLVMEDGKIRSTLARAVEEATNIASNLGK
jgi:pyrroline-5-carboxylate reductase